MDCASAARLRCNKGQTKGKGTKRCQWQDWAHLYLILVALPQRLLPLKIRLQKKSRANTHALKRIGALHLEPIMLPALLLTLTDKISRQNFLDKSNVCEMTSQNMV